MKRTFIITVVSCVLAICTRSAESDQSGNNKNAKPQKADSPSLTYTYENNDRSTHTTQKPDTVSPSFYAALKQPEWWLVAAAFFTLGMIYIQAREMARATKEMQNSTEAIKEQTIAVKDSVALQKTLKRQWVNLENWKIYAEEGMSGEIATVYLSFDITNPTDMMLTLKHAVIYFIEGNQYSSPNIPLAPTKSYPVMFNVVLSEPKITQYLNNGLSLTIFGNIVFKDNFGDRRSQLIGQNCMGGIGGFIFTDFDRWINNDNEDDED